MYSENSVTFATQLGLRPFRAFSSAGLEHLPYKQRVGGSNPSTPTKGKFKKLLLVGIPFVNSGV